MSATIVEVPQHGSSILQLEVHHGVPGQDQVELGDGVHHRVVYLGEKSLLVKKLQHESTSNFQSVFLNFFL